MDTETDAATLDKAVTELLNQDTEDFTPRERVLYARALLNYYDLATLATVNGVTSYNENREAWEPEAKFTGEGILQFIRESALSHLRLAEVEAAL